MSNRHMRAALPATALLAAAFTSGCGSIDSPTSPSSGAVVTFAVAGETFRVALTTPEQIAAARAAQSGAPARIPIGRLRAGTQVNVGWNWHLQDVTFAEVTIELCDGKPSDVQREGVQFGGGQFCPWTATVVRVDERDSR
jgi:hypothetical protein